MKLFGTEERGTTIKTKFEPPYAILFMDYLEWKNSKSFWGETNHVAKVHKDVFVIGDIEKNSRKITQQMKPFSDSNKVYF